MANEPRNTVRWCLAFLVLLVALSCGAKAANDLPASKQKWRGKVSQLLAMNLHYVPNDSHHGDPGHPVLGLVTGRGGSIHSLKVAQSSGIASLDQVALNAVWLSRQFPPFALDMEGKEIELQIPFIVDTGDPEPGEPSSDRPVSKVPTPSSPKVQELIAILESPPPRQVVPDNQSYAHARTGLSLTLRAPLEARPSERRTGQYDALSDVVSKSGAGDVPQRPQWGGFAETVKVVRWYILAGPALSTREIGAFNSATWENGNASMR